MRWDQLLYLYVRVVGRMFEDANIDLMANILIEADEIEELMNA